MLPIVLPQKDVDALLKDAQDGSELEVDLPNQVVRRPNGETISFDVESFRKHCLVEGLDDINLTLTHNAQIETFEKKRTETWPWLDGVSLRSRSCYEQTERALQIGYHGKIVSGDSKTRMDW